MRTTKNELKAAKEELKTLRKKCGDFVNTAKSLQNKSIEFDTKLTDLESRSMRDNLLLYGIREGGEKEDYGEAVKDILRNVLNITNAGDILFDRAHRVGQFSGGKVRPIVVKFHYFTDREKNRKASFGFADELKARTLVSAHKFPSKSETLANNSIQP